VNRDFLQQHVRPLSGTTRDFDALLVDFQGVDLVLIGEASHGTHEFYQERANLTRRLIEEEHFSAVVVEADWPDAYRVNRYVRSTSADEEALEALDDFERFPAWMWRNADVLDFIGWLRSFNERRPAERRVGFYGLDLYSLHASMRAVIRYLNEVDPNAAVRARDRYGCFDRYGTEPQHYGYAASLGFSPSCERAVLAQLTELQRQAGAYMSRDGRVAADEFFFAEQNARLVRNAEHYYRTMFRGRVESWNLRDRHMTETLGQLREHLRRNGSPPRLVVWAHNSHLGDARATEMGEAGEWNVGQLARETFGEAVRLVGFTTHTGTVTAASEWDGPAERKQVRPSLEGSYERLFHDVGIPQFLVPIRTDLELAAWLSTPRLERAIGVIYAPSTERRSHYFQARLSNQFDFVIHIDETRAVDPLERVSRHVADEVDETFPSGL